MRPLRWIRTNWIYTASVLIMFAIIAAIFWDMATTEYRSYNCEDRGGIRQAVGDRYGNTQSVVCEDGTRWSAWTEVSE